MCWCEVVDCVDYDYVGFVVGCDDVCVYVDVVLYCVFFVWCC